MGNVYFMAQNYVSLYLRVCSKDIFQILQHHTTVSVDKNYWSKISYKKPFWVRWAVLARLFLKFMWAYITRSALKIFFKPHNMIGHKK